MTVREWIMVFPIIGTMVTASVPVTQHVTRQRHEQSAVDVIQRLHQAQLAFHTRWGGYAADIASLTTPCPSSEAVLAPDQVSSLEASGYSLQLRAAQGARAAGRDCFGVTLVDDYFVAAAPMSVDEAGQKAFGGRADGRLYVFFDGIAPRETDISAGLATPLDTVESFKIP
jgi:hypothetical protein